MSVIYTEEYLITIKLGSTVVFTGRFVVNRAALPNIIEFYEDGNPNNILGPAPSWVNSDNAFVSQSYPFSPDGVSITTMSYYAGNYGSNTQDSTYNFYSFYPGKDGVSVTSIRNFNDNSYNFIITGATIQPFPYDTSVPPACFYNIQGLTAYLNAHPQYKIYYADNPQFPYLTIYIDSTYPEVTNTYQLTNVPLSPLLSNLSQNQIRQYETQLALFRKVYDFNYNAYKAYVLQPPGATGGPRYYTFTDYYELNNYKAGLQLVNRLYPFDVMGGAYDQYTGVPLRWIVPFPM